MTAKKKPSAVELRWEGKYDENGLPRAVARFCVTLATADALAGLYP